MNQELSLQITQQLEQESRPLIVIANEVQIQTKEDVEIASQDISNINATLKTVEKKRKEFVDPLNESLKAINSSFKKLSEPLEKAKAILSGKITNWHVTEQRRIAEEQERIRKEEERRRKIQEAHAAKGHEVSKPVEMEKPAQVENKIGSTYMRTDWVWEVENEAEIPREYLTPDDVKINTAVRRGFRSISGIRIYEKQTAVTR